MQRKDAIVSVVWVLFGLIVCISSAKFPFGRLASPGPAYLPFGCGLIFILLGSILFISTLPAALRKGATPQPASPFLPGGKEGTQRVALTLAGMLLSAAFFRTLGFALTMFLMMLFLTQVIHRQKWKAAFVFALLTAMGAVVLFQVILQTDLPSGILKF